jgi:hypothetical protein
MSEQMTQQEHDRRWPWCEMAMPHTHDEEWHPLARRPVPMEPAR